MKARKRVWCHVGQERNILHKGETRGQVGQGKKSDHGQEHFHWSDKDLIDREGTGNIMHRELF